MKIFSASKALETLFNAGQAPDLKTLLDPDGGPCEWSVEMLTGPVPDMSGKRLRHRKVFRPGETPDHPITGCNVNCTNIRWGNFFVETVMTSEAFLVCINYRVELNGFLTRRICDYIVTTNDPNVLLGRFTYNGRERGYFTLTRIVKAA